jgi:hypothetical protein
VAHVLSPGLIGFGRSIPPDICWGSFCQNSPLSAIRPDRPAMRDTVSERAGHLPREREC